MPLGRLTYCVYLVHYDFLTVFTSAVRKQYYYTLFGTVVTCFGVLVFCFALAFLAAVAIEASFLNLEKLLFSSSKPKSKK
jgi:peptidoglycan/LPS O-acetylase OafA/YrhL